MEVTRKQIIRGLLIFVGLVFLIGGCSSYNGTVSAEEEVESSWSQVENVYQRRNDLIPNLIATVKSYAGHEKGTLESVIQARANATKITIDPSNMTQEQLEKFQQSQGQLTNALSKLMMVTENYPELKADKNYMSLQAELAGTENRIAVERKKFNDLTKDYNKRIRRLPHNILASMFGFEKRAYFKADDNAKNAPDANKLFGDN